MYTDVHEIELIEKIIGDDLLTMEKRTKLIASITDVVDNTKILQDWMVEENARLKQEGQMAYAREEGMAQGIKKGRKEGRKEGAEEKNKEVIVNMLKEKVDYNFISKVTGKTIEEIKEIEESIK